MRQQGFILPTVLLLLTLLVLIAAPLHNGLIIALRSKADLSLAKQAENKASSLGVYSAFDFKSSTSFRQKNKCFKNTSSFNRVTITRSFCSSFHSASLTTLSKPIIDSAIVNGKENLPSFDFGELFKSPQNCNFLGGQITSNFAVNLSPGSVQSSNFCNFISDKITKDVTFAANLRINSPLILVSSLAVKGFLLVNLPLQVSPGSHNIFAAGDIFINNLSAKNPSEIRIISASGDVKINQISGPIAIKVFAANNAKIPSNTQLATSGFQDLALDFLPIGFAD